MTTHPRAARMAVLVAALGYFVDIYDLLLFSIIRLKSLGDLGLTGAALKDDGILLLNMQMGGMLVGGVLWGILGDKRGRLSVLFGSILLYSLANIANGFVQDVPTYAVLRFVAGVGLAGELGAGITLVSELMSRERRGYGTTIVASVGVAGAIAAAMIAERLHWRTCYFIGGGMGLALLLLRIGVFESGLWGKLGESQASRGNFFHLFTAWARTKRYLGVIAIGLPIWFAIGILVTFSPELGAAMGMTERPNPGRAVLYAYAGLVVGDLVSGGLSQLGRSRRRVVLGFLVLTAACVAAYFLVGARSLTVFYAVCVALGFATGYWAVFMTMASEQFGTNLRATVTTSVPNFVRGSVVPMTLLFQALTPSFGILAAALAVGALTLALALVALAALDETYGKDLDFLE
jgi:MFS transporter, putative metabolite:H+ symporter